MNNLQRLCLYIKLRCPISRNFSRHSMAKSKFEYVKDFEQEMKCLNNCWIVVRIDGKGFHRFTDLHGFEKPNDDRGLSLMSKAASSVFEEFRDVILSFGHSDEFSFIFKKDSIVFNRRVDKILSIVNSIFSASYVYHWRDYFPNTKLLYPPSFDARIVLYPTDQNLRDYLSWRQADTHVNNLYNTCFWALVLKSKLTHKEAEDALKGTLSSDKNELLFQKFKINYNNEPEMFRKGTTMIRKYIELSGKKRQVMLALHCDIIGESFWREHDELLALKKPKFFDGMSDNITFFTYSKLPAQTLLSEDNND